MIASVSTADHAGYRPREAPHSRVQADGLCLLSVCGATPVRAPTAHHPTAALRTPLVAVGIDFVTCDTLAVLLDDRRRCVVTLALEHALLTQPAFRHRLHPHQAVRRVVSRSRPLHRRTAHRQIDASLAVRAVQRVAHAQVVLLQDSYVHLTPESPSSQGQGAI